MKVHKIRGGNQTSLENHEYTISVGISLGNRWFTPENIVELIKWSLKYTKDYVVICPADDIHAINLEIRNRKTKEAALRLARKRSQKLIKEVVYLIDAELDDDQKDKLIYATWSDVVDGAFQEKVNFLYRQYESNLPFRNEIQRIVTEQVSKEERNFSKEDIEKFGTYILEELPEVTARVPVKGIVYDAYAYPYDNDLTVLIEKIQQREIFPEIGEVLLDTEPKVFIEVR